MKKGFSLIELLIVVVIVGILVTAALPKYRAAMERGRAQEAIANLKEASDILNLEYVRNDNQYPTLATLQNRQVVDENRRFLTGSFTKQHGIFNAPQVSTNPQACDREIQSLRTGGDYTLIACNNNGRLDFIACTPGSDALNFICEWIGAENTNNASYPYRITW